MKSLQSSSSKIRIHRVRRSLDVVHLGLYSGLETLGPCSNCQMFPVKKFISFHCLRWFPNFRIPHEIFVVFFLCVFLLLLSITLDILDTFSIAPSNIVHHLSHASLFFLFRQLFPLWGNPAFLFWFLARRVSGFSYRRRNSSR